MIDHIDYRARVGALSDYLREVQEEHPDRYVLVAQYADALTEEAGLGRSNDGGGPRSLVWYEVAGAEARRLEALAPPHRG